MSENVMETTGAEFLAGMFEYETCAECGGDVADHTAVPLNLGTYGCNWFARCDLPAKPEIVHKSITSVLCLCGMVIGRAEGRTYEPAEVTCQTCITALEDAAHKGDS